LIQINKSKGIIIINIYINRENKGKGDKREVSLYIEKMIEKSE